MEWTKPRSRPGSRRSSPTSPASIHSGTRTRPACATTRLDSLSLLEIGVDVDLAFKLELPDERYKEIESLPQMVALVQGRLAELSAATGAAPA